MSRFVGLELVRLGRAGLLPADFGLAGGVGDVVIAVLAFFLLLQSARPVEKWKALLVAWNLLGVLDMLFVVGTAARYALLQHHPLPPLTVLPLSLLPTFLVPMLIFTHVVIFVRLRASGKSALV